MAKSKPAPQLKEFHFEKGKSGNPNGRPPLPAELKAVRKLNKIKVSQLINDFMNMSIKEIEDQIFNKDVIALESMIGKIIIEAQKIGDYSRVNFLFDRMIGKVTDKVEHAFPKPTVIKLLGDEGSLVLGSEKVDEDDI